MNGRAYYNENDPFAAAWLRNLIAAEHIAPGDVDERSIVDVRPDDVRGYTQCHFFAGIGGWSYALRLAGWPDSKPVWTGSCPCQPFSQAGRRRGASDERHLWPELRRLIFNRSPAIVFGEQVASRDGREWLWNIRADLEGMDYAVGAADLCAAGVGAPHIRPRLYWVADYFGARREGLVSGPNIGQLGPWRWSSKEDLRDIAELPLQPGDRWPQPLLRQGHDGLSTRVARLRAYGNAIVPQVAAQFILAAQDAIAELNGGPLR